MSELTQDDPNIEPLPVPDDYDDVEGAEADVELDEDVDGGDL